MDKTKDLALLEQTLAEKMRVELNAYLGNQVRPGTFEVDWSHAYQQLLPDGITLEQAAQVRYADAVFCNTVQLAVAASLPDWVEETRKHDDNVVPFQVRASIGQNSYLSQSNLIGRPVEIGLAKINSIATAYAGITQREIRETTREAIEISMRRKIQEALED